MFQKNTMAIIGQLQGFFIMIRKFKKEDLPQILELCREVRQHHIDLLGGYFTEQNDEYETSAFFESLENDNVVVLVAEYEGKLNGYLLGEFKELPYLLSPKIAHIGNFGVTKNQRGQGIGKQLMDAFFELCQERNVKEIRLGVYNQNEIAYKFYEHYGFKALEQKMVLNLDLKK